MYLSHSGPSDALSSLSAATAVPSVQRSLSFWKQSWSGTAWKRPPGDWHMGVRAAEEVPLVNVRLFKEILTLPLSCQMHS